MNFENVTTPKKVLVLLVFFATIFGGLISGIIGINDSENYLYPYIFRFTAGIIGFTAGIYFTYKVKKYVLLNSIMQSNYSNLSMMFSLAVAGNFLLVGSSLNYSTSELRNCDRYSVKEKIYIKAGVKTPEENILIVDFNGGDQKLFCKHNFWNSIETNQKIMLCVYQSKIGFDYVRLPNDF
ncbi:hypothetical protein EOD40_13580 [Flavobacterium sufflavum]|uniref:Uncharacterized protein n=1 Tax=Flavobacterium sufflavum TaxID=1921138 RepID=A0A3S2U0A7_9FLAO|nr:hypothetical protein [Flavobacterium sufflavum]RVT73944.1 hypothetical protein EOD40_13580 [Flavobacterium sufflavum]